MIIMEKDPKRINWKYINFAEISFIVLKEIQWHIEYIFP